MSLNKFRLSSLSEKHEEEEVALEVKSARKVEEEKIKSSKKTKPAHKSNK